MFEHHFLPSKEKIWCFLSFVCHYLEEVETLDEVDTDDEDDTELEVDTLKREIIYGLISSLYFIKKTLAFSFKAINEKR